MKLIDSDAFEKWLKEFYPSHLEIISGIRNAPTVDAVSVVRCGECEKYSRGFCLHGGCYAKKPDNFCNFGKRKYANTP